MEFSGLWIYLADSDLMLKETATNLLCEDFFLFLMKPKMPRKSQSSKPDHFCPGGFFSVPLTKIKLIIYFPSPIINSSPYGKVLIQSQNVCHSASL
jgi:hypothetical protein